MDIEGFGVHRRAGVEPFADGCARRAPNVFCGSIYSDAAYSQGPRRKWHGRVDEKFLWCSRAVVTPVAALRVPGDTHVTIFCRRASTSDMLSTCSIISAVGEGNMMARRPRRAPLQSHTQLLSIAHSEDLGVRFSFTDESAVTLVTITINRFERCRECRPKYHRR
ncbi:unnamed protein product [Ascophyllum nodosum]